MLAEGTSEQSALSGLKILIAEDNWNLAQSLKDYVEAAGGKVVGLVATVRDGLQVFERAKVNVLVADMNLRDGMADALIEAAVDMDAGVVVVTGFKSLPSDSDHLVDEWIEKPVEETDLIVRIKRASRL
ncbi:MAG: hypothetical protein NW216_08170 [Hyphomicrobium sp.]|nr:hypothetical protein [Hyphomicrobium sp.]